MIKGLDKKFILPNYFGNNFANIPETIKLLFGLKTTKPTLSSGLYKNIINDKHVDKIVLFLVDGFGYNSWKKYSHKFPTLDKINKEGQVSPITAVFPSTTAAALTTTYSGLTPQEHELYEWFMYFPEIDKILASLPFSLPGGKSLEKEVDPKILFNKQTFFEALALEKIPSFAFVNQDYAQSSYSKITGKGSIKIPFKSWEDLRKNLLTQLAIPGKAYYYVYWDLLDHASHHFGPNSKEYLQELESISDNLGKLIDKKSDGQTLLIITADHGHIAINPKETIFLKKYRTLLKNFEVGKSGKPILPTGNPRDIFFHIKGNKLDETIRFLHQKLGKKAEIIKIKDAVEMGLFGRGKPSKNFLNRIGNLLVLPTKNYTVWYEYPDVPYPNFLGHHGGLSEDEMLIPFALLKI